MAAAVSSRDKPSLTLVSGEATVRRCVRDAMQQLEAHLLTRGAAIPARLVVVGEPAIDEEARAYLARLNEAFPIPLTYDSVPLP